MHRRSRFFLVPFRELPAIVSDASLNDVSNVGPLTCAVGERGVICFSDDGGTTWTSRITPFECSLKSVCFLTNTIGWVAGHRTRTGTMSQHSAVLLHTRDGGKSWMDLTEARRPRSRRFFTSAGIHIAGYHSHSILRTGQRNCCHHSNASPQRACDLSFRRWRAHMVANSF